MVSNPISGEVGAAASASTRRPPTSSSASFQTPSAGRWVLQLTSDLHWLASNAGVSNPISGEVGAAARPRCRKPP